MNRRLYYLLPDTEHVGAFVDDLKNDDIALHNIHVVVKEGTRLDETLDVHSQNEPDRDYILEWYSWRLNLVVFFIALFALVRMLLTLPTFWAALPLAVMAITFSAGVYFVKNIPNIHLNEFASALSHGEILMMVDVPAPRLQNVMQHIHNKHPEAIEGGTCWHI